jgi:hypothetical protein
MDVSLWASHLRRPGTIGGSLAAAAAAILPWALPWPRLPAALLLALLSELRTLGSLGSAPCCSWLASSGQDALLALAAPSCTSRPAPARSFLLLLEACSPWRGLPAPSAPAAACPWPCC